MVSAFFVEYYAHLFTSLILYTTQRNGMTTKSISSSNGLTRPITLTATTKQVRPCTDARKVFSLWELPK